MTDPGCGSACGDLRPTDQRFLACFLNSSLRGDEGVRWETRHCLSPSGTAAFLGQGFVLCDGQRLQLILIFLCL